MTRYFFALLVFAVGCIEPAGTPGDPRPPATSFVPSPDPMEVDERGVDAVADVDLAIQVEWFRPDAGRVDEVRLYRGAADADTGFAWIGSFAVSDTVTVDGTLPDHGTWRYAIETVGPTGVVSVSDDTAQVTLVAKAEGIEPFRDDAVDAQSLVFRWLWPEEGTVPRFVVRLESLDDGEVVISEPIEFFEGSVLESPFWDDGPGPGQYRWRVDAVDPGDAGWGSESTWTPFRVN